MKLRLCSKPGLLVRVAVSIQAAGMRNTTSGNLHLKALTHVDKLERTVYFADVQFTELGESLLAGQPRMGRPVVRRWCVGRRFWRFAPIALCD